MSSLQGIMRAGNFTHGPRHLITCIQTCYYGDFLPCFANTPSLPTFLCRGKLASLRSNTGNLSVHGSRPEVAVACGRGGARACSAATVTR